MTNHSWCTGDVGLLDVRECVKPCMQPEQAIRIPDLTRMRGQMCSTTTGLEYPSGSTLSHLSLSTRQVLVIDLI